MIIYKLNINFNPVRSMDNLPSDLCKGCRIGEYDITLVKTIGKRCKKFPC